MRIYIVTPSFNQLDFLKRCVASVADQAGLLCEQKTEARGQRTEGTSANCSKLTATSLITVHHHVQDGGSTDGTRQFLAEQLASSQQPLANSYTFSYGSAPDEGMYDAINRGVKLAIEGTRHQASGTGEKLKANSQKLADEGSASGSPTPNTQCPSRDSVIAWLNCDEQYLPGTLQKVSAFFEDHPQVDILFGGMLMVDAEGKLLACRKAMPMRRLFLASSYLYNYSCAMFFRWTAWERLGGLDTAFRNAGDEELVRRAVGLGLKTAVLDDYLSAFTYADHNLSSKASSAVQEHETLKQSGSAASRILRLPINLLRLAEKGLRGGLTQCGTVAYDIYAEHLDARTHFKTSNPSCRWPGEAKPYLTSHRLKGVEPADRRR